MATIKKYPNPINIAPFVDILLVVFVILVIVARFGGDNPVNQGDVSTYKNNALAYENEKLKEEVKKLKDYETNTTQMHLGLEQNYKSQYKEISAKSDELLKKNNELKQLLEKEKLFSKEVKDKLVQKNIEVEKQAEQLKSSGVYVQIDSNGLIWLINPNSGQKNIQINVAMYRNIFQSLAGSNMVYYYDQSSEKSIETLRRIQSSR